MTNPEPRHETPDEDAPDYLPNQAEGTAQTEPLNEHLRTPGQAEGEPEAVEAALADQPTPQQSKQAAEPSLWERIKALFNL